MSRLPWTALFLLAVQARADWRARPVTLKELPAAASLGAFLGNTSALRPARSAQPDLLAAIVATARQSPTGRRVLERAQRALHGKPPLPVAFADLGANLGEYDYVERVMRVSRRLMRGDQRLAGAALIHEALHVAQHSEGAPAEALEMELEAHAVSLKVLQELGVPRVRWDEFSKTALAKLRRGPKSYSDWMAKQLPGRPRLENKNFEELSQALEEEADKLADRVNELSRRLADNPGVSELKKKLEKARSLEDWARADAALLQSRAGRRRYSAFARRVQTFLRRFAASL